MTVFSDPPWHAACSGVFPRASVPSTSAPASSSSFTSLYRPCRALLKMASNSAGMRAPTCSNRHPAPMEPASERHARSLVARASAAGVEEPVLLRTVAVCGRAALGGRVAAAA